MTLYGEFLTTLGIEYEGIGLSKEKISEIIMGLVSNYGDIGRKVNLVHDASTEFNASFVRTTSGHILVSNHTPEMANIFSRSVVGSQVMGYELVTHPLQISQMGSLLYPLITSLVNSGDFISDRAAVHYHIGFVNNLRILQNFLKLSLMLDPVLFRLGGMGRTFRGKINHSAYARPLLNSCAVNVRGGNKETRYARIINPMSALDAKSVAEFWASFGLKYQLGGSYSKYHPSRYQGINFFALFSHGTVEFRHFNQTHDVFLIIAVGKMLRAFTELSTVISKRDVAGFSVVPSNKEISMSDASDIIGKLISLCHAYEVEDLPTDEEMEVIMQTISNSHFEEIPEIPVLTHVREEVNTIPVDMARAGNLQFFSEVLPPHIVDIHNICFQSIFMDVSIENPTASSQQVGENLPLEFEEDEEEENHEEEYEEEYEENHDEEGD